MKKILLLAFGLVSLVSSAQKTIFEEKMDNKTKIVTKLFPKGNTLNVIKTINKSSELSNYDSEGNKNIIIDNKELSGLFVSESEKNLLTYDMSKGPFKAIPKYIIEGKQFDVIDSKTLITISNLYGKSIFTSKNEYELATNKKDLLNNAKELNLLKEEIFLNVRNIQTGLLTKNKIATPDIKRYVGDKFIKTKENLGCKININFDESIDLITKSITSDYKKVVLYKTRLSDKGEKIKEVEFKLDMPSNYVFIYSNNKAGFFGYSTNNTRLFLDDLSINNYIEDSANGDIYIYGLFGNKAENLNFTNNIEGYYVFKFDKNGSKIWESINPITDKVLNKNHVLLASFLNITDLNNKLFLNIKVNPGGGFYNGCFISKDTGKQLNSKTFQFNESFSQYYKEYDYFFINSTFDKDVSFKKKKFSYETIAFLNFDNRVLNYIKNVNSKKEINFDTYLSTKGIWLIESDNETYYKVTYFEHE